MQAHGQAGLPIVNVDPDSVFLNCPYDAQFEKLFLAYIAGIAAFGLTPRAALEIGGGQRRLDRIIYLIRSCRYSIHDLSRTQLDIKRPVTPRFNMAFECGIAVMVSAFNAGSHSWFLFESQPRRVSKSLSDLAGTDAYIHGARINGVMRELGNALVRGQAPTVAAMMYIYRDTLNAVDRILKMTGARSVFEARAFAELVLTATMTAKENQ